MLAWVKSATASKELLRSDDVSSFSWVGKASAMPCRMELAWSGFAMVAADEGRGGSV